MAKGGGTTKKVLREYKVPGGKLLRIELDVEKDVIKNVRITGDFFMYPEESILTLENILVGTPYRRKEIHEKLMKFFKQGVQLIGATPEDLLNTLKPKEVE